MTCNCGRMSICGFDCEEDKQQSEAQYCEVEYKKQKDMHKKVWKFHLETTDYQTVKMPKGAKILAVQTQGGLPCLWALVNPESEKEDRDFEVFGTGHNVPVGMGVQRSYMGTYQLEGGALIFHVFERIN